MNSNFCGKTSQQKNIMINSFFFKYNYLGIIQEYFQPKIGRKKKTIFSLGQENNILIKKKEGV